MKKIKIKIIEGSCGSGKRDIGPMSGGCGDPSPITHKNAHNGEESRMHRTTLAHLMADVKVLLDMIEDQDDLPEWLEAKITKAGDYMSSAARYIAGNVARDHGQLEEAKNCGCGLNPCKTYGTLEEQKIVEQEQTDLDLLKSMMAQIESKIETLTDSDVTGLISALQPVINEAVNEGFIGLTEEVLIESHFNMYNYLQDAIDENGETPCPQCLYEVLSEATCGCPDLIPEAKYRGRTVTLNKPTRGDVKKFKVYVKNAKGNVVKVNFGHGGTSAKKKGEKTMKIRKSNKKARKSFRARHNCKSPGPKWKARYWSCRKW